jgi:excisionase family DNA binding protein
MTEINIELLTRSEVAEKFKVSKQVIARWEKQGIIKRVKIGGTVRFNTYDLTELITLKTINNVK